MYGYLDYFISKNIKIENFKIINGPGISHYFGIEMLINKQNIGKLEINIIYCLFL